LDFSGGFARLRCRLRTRRMATGSNTIPGPFKTTPIMRLRVALDKQQSSASHAHQSIAEHDDTLEAHYSCLERPCACLEGWVFVGYIDEHGAEREASYRCRRCADSR